MPELRPSLQEEAAIIDLYMLSVLSLLYPKAEIPKEASANVNQACCSDYCAVIRE